MKRIGTLIDTLKNGQIIKERHHNPYLQEALTHSDILLTQKELKEPSALKSLGINSNLILEIGCYFGKNVVELAQLNPNYSVLGLDITYKRVVKTARKIKKHQIKNAFVALCDGSFLLQNIFQNESLDGVCVFFPDPWPKVRDEKNRLLSDAFTDLLYQRLKSRGFFWLKTDQESYFSKTQFLLSRKGFILSDEIPPKALNFGNYETEFQKMFTHKNISFFEGVYLKP